MKIESSISYSSSKFIPDLKILNLDLSQLFSKKKRAYSSFVTKGPEEPDLPTTSPPTIHEPSLLQHTHTHEERNGGEGVRNRGFHHDRNRTIEPTSLAQFQRTRNRRPPPSAVLVVSATNTKNLGGAIRRFLSRISRDVGHHDLSRRRDTSRVQSPCCCRTTTRRRKRRRRGGGGGGIGWTLFSPPHRLV